MNEGRHRPPAVPLVLSAIVLIAGILPTPALRDSLTGKTPEGVTLVVPTLYVILSPMSRALDALGLLSIGQHVALIVWVIGTAALVSVARGHAFRALAVAASAFVVLLAVYAIAAVMPRPMASLAVRDPDVVSVDFHSHTNSSGDARRGFTPEENRSWHRGGGFDAAYISDHRTFAGAEAARKRNPLLAGDGTVLLSGYEGRYLGTFVIFLSVQRADSAVLINSRRNLNEGTLLSGRMPMSVVALPSPLIDVQAVARDGPPRMGGIELIDASPRGFSQHDRDGAAIIRRADSLGLALVFGSNNHGWGSIAPAWTLLKISGWRMLAPDSLAARIEGTMRTAPRTVQIIERRRPVSATISGLAVSPPIIAWQTLAALTIPERLAWIVWLWVIALAVPRLRALAASRNSNRRRAQGVQ